MICLSVFGAWLLADTLSGVAHWAQDRVLQRSESKFWNSVIDDNVLHHTKPAAMTQFSFFENIRVSATALWPLTLVLYLIGSPTMIWLAILFLSFANGVHWFAHQRKVNRYVKLLQRIGIFSSFNHHMAHHSSRRGLIEREEASIKFCVMTDWMNPILDGIGIFQSLDVLVGWFRSEVDHDHS